MNDETHNQDYGFKAVLAKAIRNDENITSAKLVDEYYEYKKELYIDTRQGALNLSIEIPFSITLRYLLEKHGTSELMLSAIY